VEAAEKALRIFILWGQVDIMKSDIGARSCFWLLVLLPTFSQKL